MNETSHDENDESLAVFDGGDTGCGELLLDLLLFMKKQPDGAAVRVRALDPGAPLEIPAWCRLTRHELLSSEHPIYKIRKPVSSTMEEKPE
jgi:tRNA 2-thiouridine synthesizing protein A